MKALIAVLAGVICLAGCGSGGSIKSYTVSGAITWQGSALSGVTVTLSSAATGKSLAAAATDASGAYAFRVTDIGNYSAYPSKSGYSFSPAALPIGVSSDSGGNNFTAAVAPAPQATPLPRTGQTDTYLAGDDGALQKGIAWPSPRFTDSGRGTVTDNLTGLIWLKNANCFAMKAWSDAVATASTLASGACGLTDNSQAGDWRLPNVSELSSLTSVAAITPAMPDNPFTGVQTTYYWSSTTSAAVPDYAWVLYTLLGNTSTSSKAGLMNVWPVRSGSAGAVKVPRTGQIIAYTPGDDGNLQAGAAWPAPRFTDNGDGTVTDKLTTLVWLKNANCTDDTVSGTSKALHNGQLSWQKSVPWVNNLRSGLCGLADSSQAGDWRIPNRSEFLSLFDRSQDSPGLPAGNLFTAVELNAYWSSTTLARPNGSTTSNVAWCLQTQDGETTGADSTYGSIYSVWAVRDPR